jgi:hypothetical protein
VFVHAGCVEAGGLSAADLGGAAGSTALPVGLVALLCYEADRGWAIERLSPGQAGLALTEHAVAARSRPAAVIDALATVATASAVAGSRGEAGDATRQLLAMLR